MHPFRRRGFDETVWYAQVVLWLPIASSIVFACLALVLLATHGVGIHLQPVVWWRAAIGWGLLALQGMAGWWIGRHDARGVWLGLALFGWSFGHALYRSYLHWNFLNLDIAYALLGFILVLQAGRAIGAPPFAPRAS